jgi:transcription antitermination factor NusG
MKVISKEKWYVLQTRSRFEKKSFELLSLQGVSVFLPTQKVKKNWSDRIKDIETPLFPGYLFIQFEEKDRYRVLNTSGIVRFVSFGGKYATLDENQIEIFRQFERFDTDIQVVDLEFYIGQEVFISSGPFKGLEAKIVQYNGKGKLLLTVESIGKGVLLEIGKTKIENKSHFLI